MNEISHKRFKKRKPTDNRILNVLTVKISQNEYCLK